MHRTSNPYPVCSLKKSHPSANNYCKEELIRDSIKLKTKYGSFPDKQPLDIRKCDVRGYSVKRRNQDYKSQIFFQTPEFVRESRLPIPRPSSAYGLRPSSSYIQNQPKRPSVSNESEIGSVSYQSDQLLNPPVKITLKLKASHTDRNKLAKFQDKLTIVELPGDMIQVSGLVPLKIATLFKTIFQDSEFRLDRATY